MKGRNQPTLLQIIWKSPISFQQCIIFLQTLMRSSSYVFLTLWPLYICFILCICKILGQITWWFRTKCQAVTYFTKNQWSEFVVKMYCIWKFLRLPWLFGLLAFPFYCHILSFKRAQLTAFTIKVHDYTLRRPQGVSKLKPSLSAY